MHNPFAEFRNVPGGYRIIAAMQYPRPGDSFLYVVLCHDAESDGWVTWTYNAQASGYSSGHYHCLSPNSGSREHDAAQNREQAFEDFAERCRERVTAYATATMPRKPVFSETGSGYRRA